MRIKHIFLAILIVAIWGFNFVVIKIGLKEIPPLTFCFARFFLASLPAIFFIPKPKIPLKIILCYSFTIFVLQFSFLFLGLNYGMSAGLASLLLQVQIFFTIFLGAILLNEKPNRWQIGGALVSLCGLVLVGKHLGGNISLPGFILIMAAAFSWGLGNFIAKKAGKVNMIALIVWSSFFAWPPLLIVSLIFDGSHLLVYSLEHISFISLLAILYIVIFSTLFGYSSWSKLVNEYPLATISPFTFLVPIFGILSSIIVLKEPFFRWEFLAAGLIIGGLMINLLGPRILQSRNRKGVVHCD